MKRIPEKLQEALDNISFFENRADRIELLIGIADQFRSVSDEIARRPFPEEHRVQGCESEAYVFAVPRSDDTLDYHFAVENPQGISAMALASILRSSLSGAPLQEVLNVDRDIVYQIFGEELSMGKNMGLTGMLAMVQAAARKRLRA